MRLQIPPIKPATPQVCDSSRSCDSSPKTCIPQVAIQFATCKLRFQSQKPASHRFAIQIQFATCTPQVRDSLRNLQVAISSPQKPATCRLRFTSRLRFQSQKPASRRFAIQFATCKLRCRSFSDPSYIKACNPQVAIHFEVVIPVPKTCIPQVAIQFATCKLRFHAQNLHPAGCDLIRNLHSAGCELSRNLRVAIPVPKSLQPAGCDSLRGLRFQSQNLHPAGCDSIRNLQVAIPIPPKKPATHTGCDSSRGLRFQSQKAASRRLRFQSLSSPLLCRKLVLIYFGFPSFLLRIQLYLACFASLLQKKSVCVKWVAKNGLIWGYLHFRKPPYGC